MGLACLLLPVTDPVEEFVKMAEKAARQWAYQPKALLEKLMGDKPPTLRELSEEFQATRRDLLGAILKGTVEQCLAPWLEQEVAPCPRCQRQLRRKRREKKVLSTLQGEFPLERPYFYCPNCRQGFCPVDAALGVAPQAHQFDVQHRVTKLAARMPFAEAVASVEELTGVRVSNHFAHDTLTAVGQAATLELVIPDAEEIARRIAKAQGNSPEPPILVVASDGAKTPTRPKAPRKGKRGPGRYREVRGARLYLLDADDEIIPVASWHQIQTAEAFRKDLGVIAQRIPQDRVRICLVGDGADGVWSAMVECFPTGRQLLDFYHGLEHLHGAGRALYGDGALEAHQWAESTMVRLAEGAVDTVLEQLRRLRSRQEAAAAEELRKLIGYLEGQRHRLGYMEAIEQGYPIGSGAIESANKFLCHARMKRSGAWWVEESGNEMLRLRCAMYNGTYDRVFAHYEASRSPGTAAPTLLGTNA